MKFYTFTRCWVHIIWCTRNHEKTFLNKDERKDISDHLNKYSSENNIFMKSNYVLSDHLHLIIDIPKELNLNDIVRYLKNASEEYINNILQHADFKWSKEFAAFSVSQSNIPNVVKYIEDQEFQHKSETFEEEYEHFVDAYRI